MAAVAAACRKTLVNARWAIARFSCTNGRTKRFLHLVERVGQGEVGGYTALPDSACGQLQLPVEKPWSITGGPFVCSLAQTGIENAPFTL